MSHRSVTFRELTSGDESIDSDRFEMTPKVKRKPGFGETKDIKPSVTEIEFNVAIPLGHKRTLRHDNVQASDEAGLKNHSFYYCPALHVATI